MTTSIDGRERAFHGDDSRQSRASVLIDADFVYANDRLKTLRVETAERVKMQKVVLPDGSPYGGSTSPRSESDALRPRPSFAGSWSD